MKSALGKNWSLGFFLFPVFLNAQVENVFFSDSLTFRVKEHREYCISNLHFLKNNEFFNPIYPGQTFFGVQSRVGANFSITEKSRFIAGIVLQKDFGDEKILSKVLPIFRFAIQKDKWKINFGSIESHVNHGLPDPLINPELVFSSPVEYGIQTFFQGKRLHTETWLDWRQLANRKNSAQEVISFGQKLGLHLFKTNQSHFIANAALLAYHKGGQALVQNLPITTRFNTFVGVKWALEQNRFWVYPQFFYQLDNSPQLQQPYKNGSGAMVQIGSQLTKKHTVQLQYWNGMEYNSPLGLDVYNNSNFDNVYAFTNQRNVIMLRYFFTYSFLENKASLQFRFEPLWDFNYNMIEHSAGLHLQYSFLGKI